MLFEAIDPRFEDLIDMDAALEPVSVGHKVTEGIIWWPQKNCLIFSDMGVGKVYKWDPETFETTAIKYPSNISNGNFIDTEGRIVTCEHATSSITRMEPDGRYMKTLATHYDGKQLNSPNDVIVDSKGRIWFTDPTFGRTSKVAGLLREPEMGFQGVYCINEQGELILSRKDFEQPNGLCMEIGEKTMLVNDTPRQEIRRFKVEDDGTLTGGEQVCKVDGRPDGTKIDKDGNIFTTASGNMQVFDKNGVLLGNINVPGQCRNFCFGGEDRSYLYFACETIYRVKTKTQGAEFFK
ncbi:MAG TPA: SMP-30/gluconolactonase/LRE family protein [Candidatus Enterocloster faecavium]|uniref:SMP-30/gluconolactonase/LRE family protein n=1 Tax=Candidatus Enterocloster faecavium TaxID=2838560 RepID=A0A9D2L8B0_9FIRM|nr:SMP-30/gluconolactonase/LRE family protein [Candidatus Enterocloster faecavium]